MRQRTQVSNDTNIANFEFDRNSTILKSLTGKVRDEYRDLIKSATGGAHLRVGTNVSSQELPEFCRQLLEIYNSEQTHFSELKYIVRINDPAIVQILDAKLLNAIHLGEALGLVIPEILNYNEAVMVRFKGAGANRGICDDIQFSEYLAYLDKRGFDRAEIDLKQLKKHGMFLCDDDGTQKSKDYSIYRSLVFDTEIDGDEAVYHLSEGGWYRVDGDFVNLLSEYLDPLFVEQTLPSYEGGGEGTYNASSCSDNWSLCLDQTNISPHGQRQIEPCDIARFVDGKIELIHVKISTQSSLLSHLFNQGINSLDLLRQNVEAQENLRKLVSARTDVATETYWSNALAESNFSVRYAVVTHKNPENLSKNLPLFSKISLYRVMQDLQTRGVDRSIEYVQDISTV